MRARGIVGAALVFGLLASGLLALDSCSQRPLERAREAAADCRTVTLVDEATHAAVTGAEDLAADEAAGLLYVSAYDRFALEDTLGSGTDELPRGGLYAVPIKALIEARGEVTVRDLLWPLLGKGDVRPHGIDLYAGPFGAKVLAVVVHRYAREGGEWKRYSGLEIFAVDERGIRRAGAVETPALCQANDVAAVSPTQFLVTRDHGACDGWMWTEDVLGLRRSTVMSVQTTPQGALARPPVPVLSGIGFANGIAIDRSQRRLVVAATREKALLVYNLDKVLSGDAGHPVGRISLPGGPDNLTMVGNEANPTVLAAVHPSLRKMGFYRRRWFGATRAPSRLVTVDMKTAGRAILYDDPKGKEFPAVTVGVRVKDHIVMGSVGAQGLRVCALEPAGSGTNE